ncbi:hypothetical protein MMC13_003439 [Lambiella insularis]|nr:hypothetical protein [Lambiella insularis]
MLPSSWTGSITTLLVLFLFSLSTIAVDFGLKLHQTQDASRFLWTSVNIYQPDQKLSDSDLMAMARVAWDEMSNDQKRLTQEHPEWKGKVPGAMAILAVDNPQRGYNVIFASSMKGQPHGTSFIMLQGRLDNPARAVLIACQQFYGMSVSDSGHNTGAQCAEPMALYAYYEVFKDSNQEIAKMPKGAARFAVWGRGKAMDPCSYTGADIYGCEELFKDKNIDFVPKSITPTDTNNLKEPIQRAEVCVFPEDIMGRCCTNSVISQ